MADVPSQSRSLPDRPSLRYLKLEARRRRSAGEFSALHEAQLAIAREHGLSSWTRLKRFVDSRSGPASLALHQLHWIISRFADADQPGWTTPSDAELREHFSERLLDSAPPDQLTGSIADMAAELGDDLVVIREMALWAEVRLARGADLRGRRAGAATQTERTAADPPRDADPRHARRRADDDGDRRRSGCSDRDRRPGVP
jgi:hypothetical protein